MATCVSYHIQSGRNTRVTQIGRRCSDCQCSLFLISLNNADRSECVRRSICDTSLGFCRANKFCCDNVVFNIFSLKMLYGFELVRCMFDNYNLSVILYINLSLIFILIKVIR